MFVKLTQFENAPFPIEVKLSERYIG